MINLSTLNENQLQAVHWGDGPLLVLAGPGSGKTRVLIFRIARLIQETPQKYFRILGLTFTNKAAAEMRERIETLVANAGERTLLTTFHSFAADLLRQHGHHIGLKPDFTILVQEEDRHSILDEAISHVKAEELFSSDRLLPLITRLIENNVNPESTLQYFQKNRLFDHYEEVISIYKEYRNLMIEYNVLGFSELIAEALRLLSSHTGIRHQIQRVYPYVCVDEFQDTNLIQYEILRHLVNRKKNNLFVVADDDQVIYQWNGANPRRIWDLRQEFDMHLIQLPQNYRCPADVVDSANRLILNNLDRPVEKGELTAHKSRHDISSVTCQSFRNFDEEVEWVAVSISERSSEVRSKCVVLARSRRLLEEVIKALDKKDIVGYLAVRKNEFESASLQWLHSMLRLANERSSHEHLQRVCKAFFTLERINLNARDIAVRSSVDDGDYLRAWTAASLERSELSDSSRKLIQQSVTRLSERLDFWEFEKKALAYLDKLSQASYDVNDIFDSYEEEKITWCQLVTDICKKYGKTEVTLNLLLQELDLMSKSPTPPKDAVPCFTIHASKGMEFEHVYIIGLVEGQLPSWAACKKGDKSQEIQEERRNCFVAITRAKESLTLSYSQYVFGYFKEPSRFLREMDLL
ncbi:MAG: ATP-depentend DNA helicase [Candidatus Synechococcus spongiarum 15L]|uniref:DNA 3'-5' helicase n=1 Tax=Candidatus Synechococcus spongiarum 15L TaxID=1608419 RepID=A0A0G8ASK6_9SYNE|nr:MAG: ATP-depentend DNA helicase [Candidatus Synechococcus spongiarum 15L]